MSATEELTNPDEILGNYKRMMADCQQIAAKISEVSAPDSCCFLRIHLIAFSVFVQL